MSNKEESSFLQGVESRLDSLFSEDAGSKKDKDPVVPKAAVKDIPAQTEVAPELKEEIREIPIVKAPGIESVLSEEKTPSPDKSTFISEIEKRFSAIFGEDEKEASPVNAAQKPAVVPDIATPAQSDITTEPKSGLAVEATPVLAAETSPGMAQQSAPVVLAEAALPLAAKATQKEPEEEAVENISTPLSTIYNSPLKDIKSVVLSIEWEISDHILEQFEEEINKLYLLYTGNRIIQGFLRILRFLGRYIRVRGVSSNQDSINLLLSVYDHMESVMISEGMTEARKHIILIDNIKKYRSWVETTDIATGAEAQALRPGIEEAKAIAPQPFEAPIETQPALEIPTPQEKPMAAAYEPASPVAPMHLELETKEEAEFGIRQPDILLKTPPAMTEEIFQPVLTSQVQKTIIEAMKGMSPDESVKYAAEKIKNIYQTELDALKEEIRVLKLSVK